MNGSRLRLQTGSGARVRQRRKDRRSCARAAVPVLVIMNEIVEVASLGPHVQVVVQFAGVSNISSQDRILKPAV